MLRRTFLGALTTLALLPLLQCFAPQEPSLVRATEPWEGNYVYVHEAHDAEFDFIVIHRLTVSREDGKLVGRQSIEDVGGRAQMMDYAKGPFVYDITRPDEATAVFLWRGYPNGKVARGDYPNPDEPARAEEMFRLRREDGKLLTVWNRRFSPYTDEPGRYFEKRP
jgi:hypothetical protein